MKNNQTLSLFFTFKVWKIQNVSNFLFWIQRHRKSLISIHEYPLFRKW